MHALTRALLTVMSCFRTSTSDFYCEVLLLDDSKLPLTAEQGIKISTKGSTILRLVFNHINLAEINYFGLRYCDSLHQTFWLDPNKTLSQHRELVSVGPPYTLYFGVKFYAEDPCRLKEEITRYLFYLQVKQDMQHGRLPCSPDLAARLTALALQAELGDYDERNGLTEHDDNVQQIYKTLTGVSPCEAEKRFLSIARTLEMYGVDLHPVLGEKQTEYFLGLTPLGVVIYKNKTQVGKYFWPRISKVHFKDTMFELRVFSKDGSETGFMFEALDRRSCKTLWACCVDHHRFFRMPPEATTRSHKLSKLGSLGSKQRYSARLSGQLMEGQGAELPRPGVTVVRTKSKNLPKILHNASITSRTQNIDSREPIKCTHAVKRPQSTEEEHAKPSAPWVGANPQSGLYNTSNDRTRSPKFPVSRVRLLPGNEQSKKCTSQSRQHKEDDRPIRQHRRRSRSRGTSSNSESEGSFSAQERRKKKNRHHQDNQQGDSAPERERSQSDPSLRRSHHRSRLRIPDVQAKEQLWKHIHTGLVDTEGLSADQLKDIPYEKVETQGDPIRHRHSHSPRPLRPQHPASNSDVTFTANLIPPLPVTRTADIQ